MNIHLKHIFALHKLFLTHNTQKTTQIINMQLDECSQSEPTSVPALRSRHRTFLPAPKTPFWVSFLFLPPLKGNHWASLVA